MLNQANKTSQRNWILQVVYGIWLLLLVLIIGLWPRLYPSLKI